MNIPMDIQVVLPGYSVEIMRDDNGDAYIRKMDIVNGIKNAANDSQNVGFVRHMFENIAEQIDSIPGTESRGATLTEEETVGDIDFPDDDWEDEIPEDDVPLNRSFFDTPILSVRNEQINNYWQNFQTRTDNTAGELFIEDDLDRRIDE